MLWLYIHFPNLLLECVSRDTNDQRPLVISEGWQGNVYQASPKAQQGGVRPGMRLKTAVNLVPELAIIEMDALFEQQALEAQARWLYRQAAHISLHPPSGLLAEVTSLKRLHGGLRPLWQRLEHEIRRRALTGQIATGLTPGAAQCLAQTNAGTCTEDADILTRNMQALGIEMAGLSAKATNRLAKLGLLTLGDVFKLSSHDIARRLEPETLHRLQQIQGTRPDLQTYWQPPHRFYQRIDFAYDIEHSTGLLFPLQRALAELEADLQWRQQDTDHLNLSFHHRNRADTSLALRTAGPEHRSTEFLALARIRLEQLNLDAPTQAMTLTVSRFIPRQHTTAVDLLGSGPCPDEAWQSLISRLQARLGEQAIRTLTCYPDHRPEKAWAPRTLERTAKPDVINGSDLPHRPLWLLRSPQTLHSPPRVWLSGPERISGGWWDGERVQRDYYIALLPSGQLAWLFRDAGGGWFIHGWFG
ncbi:Y-family DNA polymerase [Marinobacter caseinilyticus]|uniref:Y-family DNA polymerase n=1 Tax=Marinobacter caseinilyticus TaxID=2692195 RepID=UPI00140E4275|nr:DNA polymerase Y family protein [Marinobacter caseinilyticus]